MSLTDDGTYLFRVASWPVMAVRTPTSVLNRCRDATPVIQHPCSSENHLGADDGLDERDPVVRLASTQPRQRGRDQPLRGPIESEPEAGVQRDVACVTL
ncbi:hypothetical protein AVEN_232905-1 [Araneus ventricosus]|uniref:Uncharacterized protein n=1 Tax=Araneus ventricosus TaxID=182803 RepID=A0A4Y2UKB9_ARAVE|nr:hypothetical protein AVEN_232905-1 [Araneus ventricosus]